MAIRISELPSAGPLDNEELIVVVQGGVTKKIQLKESPFTTYLADVTLTDTIIKSSNTTPYDIIPPPGADKIIVPLSIAVLCTYNTATYADFVASRLRIDTHILALTSCNFTSTGVMLPTFQDITVQNLINKSLNFFTPIGNPTTGDGTMRFLIRYNTLSL